MASSSFPSSSLLSLFTPISEHESEEEDESSSETSVPIQERSLEEITSNRQHHPTPFRTITSSSSSSPPIGKIGQRHGHVIYSDKIVDFSKCRPSYHNAGMFKSAFFSLTGKKSPSHFSSPSSSFSSKPRDEKWKVEATDLSEKLCQATRKRDEALAEISKLKQTVAELENKLAGLDSYCYDIKFLISSTSNHRGRAGVFPLDDFLHAVQESRKMVRHLGRALSAEIGRSRTPRMMDKIFNLLQPFNLNVSVKSWGLPFYLEVLLNRVFYEDFESTGFDRRGMERVLDPYTRRHSNKAAYDALKEVSWEEVLAHGTRHHSEDLGEFCDRKMSAVASMLGWVKPWPKTMLKAFFWAAKWLWLLHLLAWSVHPAVPVFRVGYGCRFDHVYMEDVGVDQGRQEASRNGSVIVMVAPGFYVYSSVVKCKVMCMYLNGDR